MNFTKILFTLGIVFLALSQAMQNAHPENHLKGLNSEKTESMEFKNNELSALSDQSDYDAKLIYQTIHICLASHYEGITPILFLIFSKSGIVPWRPPENF
jgi:hypothetical protein